jgi:hypothetical protein
MSACSYSLGCEAVELGDDDVLVRGGLSSDIDQMVMGVEDNYELDHIYALSFYGNPNRPLSDVCREWVPHGRVRLTTAGKLRERFSVVKTGDPDHYDVVLPGVDLWSEVNYVVSCLDPPIPNPGKAPR